MAMYSRPALAGLCLLLCSCATRQLVPDFAAFSEAYAHDMNWQMLLNLARLDQGHPAYFMAIGEIRLGRAQSVSLDSQVTSQHTTSQNVTAAIARTAQNVLSGQFTPKVSTSATPSFVFIPINSEEATRQLLEPISISAFNTLYQQGWPVDQLLRVLVERVEVEFPATEPGRAPRRIVLTNSPTRADPASFSRFLRMCEFIRDLQLEGALSLVEKIRETGETEPEAKPASQPAAPSSYPAPRSPGGATGGAAPRPASAEATDKKGADSPKKTETTYRFSANRDLLARLAATRKGQAPYHDEEIDNLVEVLKNSSLAVASSAAPGAATVASGVKAALVIRSFRSVLDAVAKEQRSFDSLAAGEFLGQIPVRQRQPVLRTVWPQASNAARLAPVIQINYFGSNYQITDPAVTAPDKLDSRWNRDVFRLLVDLSFQVTVDITKFQRRVLELTQ